MLATVACGSSVEVANEVASEVAETGDAFTEPTPTPTPTPTPSTDAPEPTVWPNAKSKATSDPWLVANHDRLTEMHPKVLTINFDNDAASKARWKTRVGEVIAGLAEGSRYHGYQDPEAKAFLHYEVAKWVDLSDETPVPGWTHKVSTKYPVSCRGDAFYKFDYAALFTRPDITDALGAPLCDLFERGDVHEVWLYANGDPERYECPDGRVLGDMGAAEILESKPVYDAQGKTTGRFQKCAGNGCLGDRDFEAFQACGRTVRVLYINSTRGPGCAIHSAGHGYEWMAKSGAVPEITPRFKDFAGFDLDRRYGLPFRDWYACDHDDCRTFDGPNALTWKVGQKTGRLDPLDQTCGNVHFAPNARIDYDENATEVLTTCAHYGLHDGAGGRDEAEIFSKATYARYQSLAPDCGGAWQVYWRQSFPGLGNHATDADGAPLRNWWPYLFY